MNTYVLFFDDYTLRTCRHSDTGIKKTTDNTRETI